MPHRQNGGNTGDDIQGKGDFASNSIKLSIFNDKKSSIEAEAWHRKD